MMYARLFLGVGLLVLALLACCYWPTLGPVPELQTTVPVSQAQIDARYTQWRQRRMTLASDVTVAEVTR